MGIIQPRLSEVAYISYLAQITHTHTHTQAKLFNGPLSGTTRVGQYQKKHSPTHTHPDHQTSFINLLHLLRSIASSLFNLGAWQSFSTTSLRVLFSLPPCSGILCFILHVFLLFTTHAHDIAACFALVPIFCHIYLISLNLSETEATSITGTPFWWHVKQKVHKDVTFEQRGSISVKCWWTKLEPSGCCTGCWLIITAGQLTCKAHNNHHHHHTHTHPFNGPFPGLPG